MSMPTPPTGDRQFRNELVRLGELTVHTFILEDLVFTNCSIVGPAVVVLDGETQIVHCRWDTPSMDALIWDIPEDRHEIVGAVVFRRCAFSGCSFSQVGIGTRRAGRALIEAGFNQP